MMRGRRAIAHGLALAAVLSLWALPQAASQPGPRRVGFIGVWDRADALLDAASHDAGLTASFWRPEQLLGTDASGRDTAAQCDLLFVLNLQPDQSIPLRDLVQRLMKARPSLKLFVLDARDSQTDLKKAGLVTDDEEIPKYWRANGAVNMRRLMHYVSATYLGAIGAIEPPIAIPDFGYYDPDREDAFDNIDTYRDFKRARGRWFEGAPVAALIIQQSFWVTHDTKVIDAQVRALERERINAVVIFADREDTTTGLLTATHPDLIVEDRHGAMWESRDVLEKLDAPYLRPISMLAYTIDQWRKDPAGLASRDVGLFMTLQESWGTIEPIVVGGLEADISGFQLHVPVADGVEKFARRAKSWLTLRTKPNADKKLAIIYYNKGLGKDDLMRGSPTGAFLDGPESLERFLPALTTSGYTIRNAPPNAADLIARIKTGGFNAGPWAADDLKKAVASGQPALVPLSLYMQWFNAKLTPAGRAAVIKNFGPPPGKFMVTPCPGGHEPCLVVPRVDLGNVILVPQPERGEVQDDTLLHSRDVPPPHNYLAFYWWLQEEFHADAIVHWGTHGSLELLPGKEAGLTPDSWGDICVGDMPVVDLWIMDNMAESTLARRRSYAELVDHLPPPALAAGLSEALQNLHADTGKFTALEPGLLKEEFRKRISAGARAEHLDETLKLPRTSAAYSDAEILRIADYVQHLAEETTPLSLHVLGENMPVADEPAYLTSILGATFLDHVAAATTVPAALTASSPDRRGWLRARGAAIIKAVLFDAAASPVPLTGDLKKDLDSAREERARLDDTAQEIHGLTRALDGRYIAPGPGPDPIRNPESAPGGRDLYSLNPAEIPTKPAWEVAKRLVDELLQKHPTKKVGLDLNGMDTMRDFGVMESQILYLMGVEPVWDRNNLAVDVALIPRATLGRPRVDVFIAMGGLYKENFSTRVELLDKAVRLAASADEPDNAVRLGTQANAAVLEQHGMSKTQAELLAPARIFGTKQGNMSGTNILYLIPRSGVWDKDSEVADVYVDSMSWVYTAGAWGQKVDGLYQQAIQGTDTLVRNWSSNMTSQLSNHHAYEYLGGLSMAVKALTGKEPDAFIADVRSVDGARMREFNEVLASNFRTELLNPTWVAGMKAHGYAGAGQAAELVKNTFGWAVTRDGAISDATWNEINDVYMNDKYKLGVREWMEQDNPHALQEMAATLLEASRKGYWKADAATVAALAAIYQDSVARHGESNGLMSGGNKSLATYVSQHLNAPGSAPSSAAPGPTAAAAPGQTAAPAGTAIVTGQHLARVADDVKPPARAPAAWWLAVAASLGSFVLFMAGFLRREGSL